MSWRNRSIKSTQAWLTRRLASGPAQLRRRTWHSRNATFVTWASQPLQTILSSRVAAFVPDVEPAGPRVARWDWQQHWVSLLLCNASIQRQCALCSLQSCHLLAGTQAQLAAMLKHYLWLMCQRSRLIYSIEHFFLLQRIMCNATWVSLSPDIPSHVLQVKVPAGEEELVQHVYEGLRVYCATSVCRTSQPDEQLLRLDQLLALVPSGKDDSLKGDIGNADHATHCFRCKASLPLVCMTVGDLQDRLHETPQ